MRMQKTGGDRYVPVMLIVFDVCMCMSMCCACMCAFRVSVTLVVVCIGKRSDPPLVPGTKYLDGFGCRVDACMLCAPPCSVRSRDSSRIKKACGSRESNRAKKKEEKKTCKQYE